jgi:FkbM family methyltransferase
MHIGSAIEQALIRWRRWRLERVPGPLGLWYRAHGEDRLSAGLPVCSDDLVVDAGGYEGEWAALMAWRYGCRILIIEPVSDFFRAIDKRFADNDRIEVVNAALGGAEGTVQISVAAAGSSIFGGGGRRETVRMCDAVDLLQSYGPGGIACLKLNIEGAEYDVLDRLAAAGMLPRIRSLVIQFHRVVPESERRRNMIQSNLAQTHHLVFDYPFIWERWELGPRP